MADSYMSHFPRIKHQYSINCSVLLCPEKWTYIFSVLPARLYDREWDSSNCQSAATQTHSPSVSPVQTLGQEQDMSQYSQTDGPSHAPMHLWAWSHTHTHTHASERNMFFTWALFALLNVNVSTIFTPASILPGRRCSFWNLNASQIELTWFFFPSHTNCI